MRSKSAILALVVLLSAHGSGSAIAASPAQKAILDQHVTAAKAAAPGFEASIERGKSFFQGSHTGGKTDSPSCTSCHTADLTKPGKTRAGKEIAPMAASVNANRYTVQADVDKWFKRNCSDVLGRECTAAEKSDLLAYLLSL